MKHDTAIPIGSGGMGEVFKAWDPDLERFVALKYLRHDDPVLVERLMREARAQARIDHPSVCKVYEVGKEDGRPYIAMEFVDGEPLDVAAGRLSVEHKVLLVKQVAEAVQAAHAAGLVHRDLKPANILVVDRDGLPHPYVLDFGIARIEEVAGLTLTGQVMGTPGYLSPEQARGDLKAIDRRTDVFSLGVILYELLGGARPFTGDSNVEILMHLMDDDPVPLRRAAPAVPRDLETVVMTCLEKDPDRRYESARALADDLGRFLDGEPVEARPVGLVERAIRRARRNPIATTAIAAAVAAVIALAVVAVGGWVKYTVDLERERDLATQNAREAEQIAEFLLLVFDFANPDESHGEELSAREILDRGAERVERELADRPVVQSRLLGMIGEVYARLGALDRAEPLLERAFDTVMVLPEASARNEIEARVRLADLYLTRSELDRAAELLQPLPEIIAGDPRLDPRAVAQGLGTLARMEVLRGDLQKGNEILSQAIAFTNQELGEGSPLMGDLLNSRAYILYELNQWDEAIADGRRALAIRERHYGPDDPRVATTLNTLGLALRGAGQLEEAAAVGERTLAIRERTLGPDHPRTSTALNNLGLVYKKMGRLERAEELYQRSLEIRVSALGEDHPRVAAVLNNLVGIALERGDLDLAESRAREALRITEGTLGPDHTDAAYSLTSLAKIAILRGQYPEAEGLAERVVSIRTAAHGPDSPSLIMALRHLGDSQLAQGRIDDAEASYTRARTIAAASYGEANDEVAEIDAQLAKVTAARSASSG
jgi:tetratricopeptide (TPR) repeat protein/predicted Ser/Thr protein kinase